MDGSDDFGGETERERRLLADREPSGLRDRLGDGGDIERRDGPQVDHLHVDAFAGETVRRPQALVNLPADRGDGHPRAGTNHARRSDGHPMIGAGLRRFGPVQMPVFDEDHRVGVVDGGPHQPVGVGWSGRHDHLETDDRSEHRLETLGVLSPCRSPGAVLGAYDERDLDRATGHESELRGLVEQLVEAHADEVDEHDLCDRPHASHRSADRGADDRRLGDRCVDDPIAAEPFSEAGGHPEDSGTDVDAHQVHARVGVHRRFERSVDGVHVAHRAIAALAGDHDVAIVRRARGGWCDHQVRQVSRPREWGTARRSECFVHLGVDLGVDVSRQLGIEVESGQCDRVNELHRLACALGPVVEGVAFVVAMPAFDFDLEQRRCASATEMLDQIGGRSRDLAHVGAVDADCLDGVRAGAFRGSDRVLGRALR